VNSKNAYLQLSKTTRKRLKTLLGERFLEAPEDLKAYAFDASGHEFLPSAVALPQTAAEVQKIVLLAREEPFPIIPRGAGTSTTAAPLAVKGGLVLSMCRMDRILEINPQDLVAVVEPGVFTGKLKKEVAKQGLFYPPDPASYPFSTIGGNVATGAGGPKGLKYGVTKDYVLGLEVVLPSGDKVFLGTRTAKGVVGYDLVHLFVGSEGTLGIITKIVLKLLPLPPAQAVVVAGFTKLEEAVTAFGQVLQSGVLPSTAELMDEITLEATKKLRPSSLIPDNIKALILFELDGTPTALKEEVFLLHKALKKAPLYQEAWTETDQEALWEIRRSISPALKALGPKKMADDIVVPRSRLVEFVHFVKALQTTNNLLIACFGHLGDGNLHVNILFDPQKEPLEKVKGVREKLLQKVLALSGTISGEHGIGLAKRAYLPWEIPPKVCQIMYQLKQVFDPQNIMNPHKVL